MDFKSFLTEAGVFFCKVGFYIADLVTLPIYTLIDRPWNHWRRKHISWSKLEDEEDPYSCYIKQIHRDNGLRTKYETLDELFRSSSAKHGKKHCFGTREVFGEEEVKSNSGKIFKKLDLGEYKWLTYEQCEKKVDNISKGLLSLGVKSKCPLVILAETRVEWILSAQACFRINVPVVTLYATLGEDGIAHGINETEVTHIITSVDLLPKLKKALQKTTRITHIVYMEGLYDPHKDDVPDHVQLIPFSDLEKAGQRDADGLTFDPPGPEDSAILMYTSGSTGVPKAVMITNKNVMASISGFYDVVGNEIIKADDRYIAYLPVAHVLELACECYMHAFGVPVGFSTPQTFSDFSTAIRSGCKGDLKVLKPTLMAAVPLMLDRVRKSILQLAGAEGSLSRGMFDFAVSYKNFWLHSGYETRLLDRFVMETYHEFMGGHMRIILCGGAPISPDTQNFIRSCLNVQVLQGYGMTETAASSSIMDYEDYSVGLVGAPLSNCKVRLVDWDEGRYHATDKPNPRGEIVVGGDCVTRGYFKNHEKTKECFKQENGLRWFYTGDIGEVMPNGLFKIIDRRTDLVKLQFGEYVALGKVEAELKTCPLVENICTIGSGLQSFLVAVVVPNRPNLEKLAKDLGKGDLDYVDKCADPQIINTVTQRIREHGSKCGLFGSELPRRFKLCSDDWLPDSGLVTAAFKIRRKIIQQHYEADIERMYSSYEANGTVSHA